MLLQCSNCWSHIGVLRISSFQLVNFLKFELQMEMCDFSGALTKQMRTTHFSQSQIFNVAKAKIKSAPIVLSPSLQCVTYLLRMEIVCRVKKAKLNYSNSKKKKLSSFTHFTHVIVTQTQHSTGLISHFHKAKNPCVLTVTINIIIASRQQLC